MQGRPIHGVQADQLYASRGFAMVISHEQHRDYDETLGRVVYQILPGQNTVQVDSGTGVPSPVPPPPPMNVPATPPIYPNYPWPAAPIDLYLPSLDESADHEYLIQCYCYGEEIRIFTKEGGVLLRTLTANNDYIYLRSSGLNWVEINTAIVP